MVITKGNEQERAQVGELVEHLQDATDGTVGVAYVDQGYTGKDAADSAAEHNVELVVVKHTEAKKGFVFLPRRWVVERTFGWLTRHRRLIRDYERLAKVLAPYHWVAFIGVQLNRLPIAGTA